LGRFDRELLGALPCGKNSLSQIIGPLMPIHDWTRVDAGIFHDIPEHRIPRDEPGCPVPEVGDIDSSVMPGEDFPGVRYVSLAPGGGISLQTIRSSTYVQPGQV
jgi:hypothetical protein